MEATDLSIDGWIDKQAKYIHTMKYYSVFKKKEILMHTKTRRDREDIMQSEISPTQTGK